MKIRADFVTNSSSSSFLVWNITNSKLAEIIKKVKELEKDVEYSYVNDIDVSGDDLDFNSGVSEAYLVEAYQFPENVESVIKYILNEMCMQTVKKTESEAVIKDALKNVKSIAKDTSFLKFESAGFDEVDAVVGEVVYSDGTLETKIITPEDFLELSDEERGGCDNLREYIMYDVEGATDLLISEEDEENDEDDIDYYDEETYKNDKYYDKELNSFWKSFEYAKEMMGEFGHLSSEIGLYKKYINDDGVAILPDDMKYLFHDVFINCNSLKSIVIPKGVERIDYNVFFRCKNLEKVTIPESVKSVGIFAFMETKLYNDENNWEDGALYIDNCLIKVKNSAIGKDFYVKPGTRLISDSVFGKTDDLYWLDDPFCSSACQVERVFIPDGVRKIGIRAFKDCDALKEVVIPDSVDNIGWSVFGYNKSVVIKCHENSYAHKYAIKNNISFELI